MVQINKETANIWEYKVGNNANIANIVYPNETTQVWTMYL